MKAQHMHSRRNAERVAERRDSRAMQRRATMERRAARAFKYGALA
jgi:hypothetical protein